MHSHTGEDTSFTSLDSLLRPTFKSEHIEEWWFLFSVSLDINQQIEHMQAYMRWIRALQQQAHEQVKQVNAHARNLLYNSLTLLQKDATYRLGDLPPPVRSLFPDQYLRDMTGLQEITDDLRLTFKRWEAGLKIVYPLDSAGNRAEGFIPLEVLAGIKHW